jgi:hypothetical protein
MRDDPVPLRFWWNGVKDEGKNSLTPTPLPGGEGIKMMAGMAATVHGTCTQAVFPLAPRERGRGEGAFGKMTF